MLHLMLYLQLAAGFVLLLLGGETLVRGSVSVARRLGVSPLLIGLTLVGFGTSTPELITSLQAALVGSPGIAVGNVVGSNIANVLLILGVAAVMAPIACNPAAFRRDGTMLALSAVACAVAALGGTLGRVPGALFLALLAGYVVVTYLKERRAPDDPSAAMHEHEADLAEPTPRALWLAVVFAVGGIALTILGARLLVAGAIGLATAAGISETVIGLTVVAIGTSLPELVTAVMASLRRQGDIAFGNIVGSNIYNVLGILGVTALVQPLTVPPEILRLDLWVMLAVTALLIAFAITGWRLTRTEGAVLLTGYVAYIGVVVAGVGSP
ncbi:MAG TPA: calcium/sodium antiporter [Geminicoccaceae bacterium]|nr:calcium/sodium antiporter [Geminicoccaceae bacterium]